jgi:hypothetical protein
MVVTGGGTEKSLRSKAGECLAGEREGDLERVSCTSSSARWTVVGVVENKTQEQAKIQACRAWPAAEASYWESHNGRTGFVLCLASTTAK